MAGELGPQNEWIVLFGVECLIFFEVGLVKSLIKYRLFVLNGRRL